VVTEDLDRAQALLDVGRPAAARARLAPVLAAEPGNWRALCLLAQAYLAEDDFGRTLTAADAGVSADPHGALGHTLRATALILLGRHEEAVEAADAAIQLAPLSWNGYALRGAALFNVYGRRREGLAVARSAIRLAPNEPGAHFIYGSLLASIGLSWPARRAFHRTLRLDPQHSGALQALARAELRAGRLRNSLRYAQSASLADPAGVPALDHLVNAAAGLAGWAFIAAAFTGIVLLFAVFPAAWLVAGLVVGGYLLFARRAWRTVPAAARPVLLRQPRVAARLVAAGVMLVAAVVVGVLTSLYVDPDTAAGIGVTTFVLAGSMVLCGLTVPVLQAWLRRRSGLVDEEPSGGTPAEAKLLIWRWFDAAALPAIGVWLPVVDPGPDWAVRAVVGTALLGLFVARARRARRSSWRITPPQRRAWDRMPNPVYVLLSFGLLAFLGFALPGAYLPDSATSLLAGTPAAVIGVFGAGWLSARVVSLPVILLRRLRQQGQRPGLDHPPDQTDRVGR
jgi:Tfp pilus assembly protein PilF